MLSRKLAAVHACFLIVLAFLTGCVGSEPGIVAHKYEGVWTELPNFAELTATESRTVTTIGTHNLGTENYGLVLKGSLKVSSPGEYRFHLESDDGSRLFINNVALIDNDGTHGANTVVSAPLSLTAGEHALRIEYFQGTGGQTLSLSYQLDGGNIVTVPASMLTHTESDKSPDGGSSGGGTGGGGNGGDDCSADQESANDTNSLQAGERLNLGEYLESNNGNYRLSMQSDGNLVLRDWNSREALWSSRTHDQGGDRTSMQSDGNLVVYTASGTPLWASDTDGSGARYVMVHNSGNMALYTSNDEMVWQTETGTSGDAEDECGGSGGGSGGGGSGGGDADSTGKFSAPSAALYSLNNNLERGFPQIIDTGYGGNGHAETWDGRIFVRTRTDGWFANAFRPERITRNSDGTVSFRQGAFGNNVLLEARSDAPDMHLNWLAIVPDPAAGIENPFPSNSNGSYSSNGSYRTYRALVYHTSTRNGDNDQMGYRRATFIVSNPNTGNAQVTRADFTSNFQKFSIQGGGDLRCIEPSVTIDGRLIICQGHPDNNGRIDNMVYSWNSTPAASNNWRAPKSLANMYWDDRNSNVDGIPFAVRYPIAERPLLDATGNDFNRGELIKGAYPWISRDGSELFYQASRDGTSGRRTGTTVVGRWTGWIFRHIDGPINRNRHDNNNFPSTGRRLFISSPGAFTTMWSPYKDVVDLKIPYSVRGPSYPIFGSNSQAYSEVGFDDYLDGNFILYYGMNEQLDRAGTFQTNRTNDTSGHFNNGTLVGAQFPLEYNNRDEIVGRYGQAIYFRGGNYINVSKNSGWNSLSEGATVDFWIRKINGSGTIRLFNLSNGFEVYLTNGNTLNGAVTNTSNNRITLSGPSILNNSWNHVALVFDPNAQRMALYLNGEERASRSIGNFGNLRTNGNVRIGPENSSGLLLLDEVKVSNVARRLYEIGHYAKRDIHTGPNSDLANRVPSHLRSLMKSATAVDRFSSAAADLGEDLFNDEILSKQRTTSCATCHDQQISFTDGKAIAEGDEPTDAGTRNTPTLFNRLFSSLQGWSGNADSLDTQALIPIQAVHEMNLPINEAITRLRNEGNYASRFQQVYGESPNEQNIPAALASFQSIQFSPRTRVDDFRDGNRSVLTSSEYRGLLLFEGKARCSGCHEGQNYTDESFRSNGIADNDDIGRAEITSRDRDYKLFKVPTLREIRNTAPYMHDGSIATLRQVVEAYNDGSNDLEIIDTDIKPLELSSGEITDLVNFLNAL
ncbi:MAG: PA14 domain-containing protein [Pseudomonadales bacterium]|nr:PA14 domain-containing protein [Pseudomonadales bacterium]